MQWLFRNVSPHMIFPVVVPSGLPLISSVAVPYCLNTRDVSSGCSVLSPFTLSIHWQFLTVSPQLISAVAVPRCLPTPDLSIGRSVLYPLT